MDNEERSMDAPKAPTYTVEVTGGYGVVSWTVCPELWGVMPRTKRTAAVDVAGTKEIAPFFEERARKLLEQCGQPSTEVGTLTPEWSMELLEVECCFGTVCWQISQGFWDALPDDQRRALLEVTKTVIHEFFKDRILIPMHSWAMRNLLG